MTAPNVKNREYIVRLLRITAAGLLMTGVALMMDAGGMASFLGLKDDGLNQIIGGMLIIMAIIDIAVVPRFLLDSSSRTKISSSDNDQAQL